MTRILDKPSAKGALATPVFELSGRATKFEFTQRLAKGFKGSDLKRTTVYLVSTDPRYGTQSYASLRSGEPAYDPEDDAVLFILSMDDGDTSGETTMEVENDNAPFDLKGKYRLFVQTDHGVVTANVRELK